MICCRPRHRRLVAGGMVGVMQEGRDHGHTLLVEHVHPGRVGVVGSLGRRVRYHGRSSCIRS